jgi:hypothetical protein
MEDANKNGVHELITEIPPEKDLETFTPLVAELNRPHKRSLRKDLSVCQSPGRRRIAWTIIAT